MSIPSPHQNQLLHPRLLKRNSDRTRTAPQTMLPEKPRMVPTNAVFDASHISRNASFSVGLLFGPGPGGGVERCGLVGHQLAIQIARTNLSIDCVGYGEGSRLPACIC